MAGLAAHKAHVTDPVLAEAVPDCLLVTFVRGVPDMLQKFLQEC